MRCIRCGADNLEILSRKEVVDFRGLTLEVDGFKSTHCHSCNNIWETDEQDEENTALIKAQFKIRRDQLRIDEGLLSGPEIDRVLNSLYLTKVRAAELFGGGPNAFGKYISGEVLQSVPMDRLLRLAFAFSHDAVAVLSDVRNAPLMPGYGTQRIVDRAKAPISLTFGIGGSEATPVILSATAATTMPVTIAVPPQGHVFRQVANA